MTTSITKTQRYLPYPLETRFHAVKMDRAGYALAFVLRRYKISNASLMRWNRRFDGTKDSLRDPLLINRKVLIPRRIRRKSRLGFEASSDAILPSRSLTSTQN